MTKINTIILSILCVICSYCNINQESRDFHDIGVYKGTDVYGLALCVADNDSVKIEEYIHEHPKIDIDLPDSNFGCSLLMWAIFNGKYKSFEALLNNGANPNFISERDGSTPLMMAASYVANKGYDDRYLNTLLKDGADAKLVTLNKEDSLYRNPIFDAITCLQYVKPLVEKGNIDVNFRLDGISIVEEAILLEAVDVAYYLVVEKNADITGNHKSEVYINGVKQDIPAKSLIQMVKDWNFETGSKQDMMKKSIIECYEKQQKAK